MGVWFGNKLRKWTSKYYVDLEGIAQLKSILAPFFAVFLTLMAWTHHRQLRHSFIKPSAIPQTSAVPLVMSSVFLMS
jgi:hypothetical protein